MNPALLYQLALFLHIIGAFGLIAALTAEAAGRRPVAQRLGPAAVGLVLIPGLYMMGTTWGPRPWILLGLASLVLIAVLGALQAELRIRGALLVGVVFLMTVKPGLLVSALVIAAAVVGGYTVGRNPFRRTTSARA